MILGEEIRRRRVLLGMAQLDLARAVCVVPPTVNRWEMGHAQPQARNLKELAKFFGVTEQKLMNPSEEDKKIRGSHAPYNRRKEIMT